MFSSILFPEVSGTLTYTKSVVRKAKNVKIANVITLPEFECMLERKTELTAKLLSQLVAVARAHPVLTRCIGNISD